MRSLIAEAELQDSIEVDSAGTGSWHVGSAPDARASAAALARGVPLEGAARQVASEDFEDFDLLLAMDAANRSELLRAATGEAQRAKVRMLREFDPASAAAGGLDVPDPYYGGDSGFDDVFELVRVACAGLLDEIRAGRVR